MKNKGDQDKRPYAILSKKRLNRRIFFIGVVFLSTLGYVGSQVFAIKLKNGEDYQKQVLSRMISKEGTIMPQRGAIVDRNNKTIAASILAYDIILDPLTILSLKEDEQKAICETLAKNLGKSSEEVRKLVSENPKSRHKIISKRVDEKIAETLKSEGLHGVWFEETFTRKYPKGEFASQLIGFYNPNSSKGQYGIEQQYNDAMLGKPGRIFSQLQDEQIVTTEVKAAENGATVVLTLDEVIQQYVETTMKKYIKEYKPINASAIVMNPNTGEIYSMFSYPYFNPAKYTNLEDQLGEEEWKKLPESEKTKKIYEAWKNFNTQNIYEPGSTFKPLVAAAVLDENLVSSKDKFVCNGSITVLEGERPIHCWKREGHGEQNLEQVLANSCNVGMIEMSKKMSAETFLKYMNLYGFGQRTNIELPGEEKGLLHAKLGAIDKATYSMGQSIAVTPIQLITAFSAIINGGYLMQPYAVSSLVGENNQMIYQAEPKVRRQVISAETSEIIKRYLQKVVDDGTGVNASITGYNIGGKTGTAQKGDRTEDKYVLSFMGYAPIDHPQVIALVVFDEIPEHSGVPSRAFKEMMLNILPYLEIELSNHNQVLSEETSKVPKLIDLDIYKAKEVLDGLGLNCEFVGIGNKITAQYPSENANWPKGSSIKLTVKSSNPEAVIQVPELLGLTVEEAKSIVGKDFTISGNGGGKIDRQFPLPGQKIEKNSPIVVKTSE